MTTGADRFSVDGSDVRQTMKAVVTTGNGGYDKLEYRDVPVPVPAADEVLLQVLAAGINNTEINTRVGWYSSSVTDSTDSTSDLQQSAAEHLADGGWNETTPFPLIQGTDCCGKVVATGDAIDDTLLGKRVLVRACMRPHGYDTMDNIWMASDFDGAFASGGVGSAVVQLAARRGARITAICGAAKAEAVTSIGAHNVLDRNDDVVATLGENAVTVVVDNVAGDSFPAMLKVLRRGGRYVSSGAIAGPVVSLDMRDMYLKDISLIGCTAWDEPVFPNLVSYIEDGEIRPLLAKAFPLRDIAQAQQEFMQKNHVGNFVLIPPVDAVG